MTMRNVFLSAALLLVSIQASAQGQSRQTITILTAVANNGDDPAGAKQVALKEHFSSRCNGRDACSQKASEVVPANNFVIEVLFACRDDTGASRQIGPKHFGASDVVELTCR
jgi:hypothetical protein